MWLAVLHEYQNFHQLNIIIKKQYSWIFGFLDKLDNVFECQKYFNKIMFKIKYIASDITIIYSNTLNFRLQHVHVRVKRSFSERSSFIFRILRSSRHCGGEHVTVGIDLTWQKYLIKLEKYFCATLKIYIYLPGASQGRGDHQRKGQL